MAYLQEKNADRSPKTITQLHAMHQSGEKIAVLTAYESSFSALIDHAGIDAMLIGDSLGNVVQGHSTTTPVTMTDMAYHTQCVSRGNQSAFLIADMPFGSYSTPEQAMENAVILMRAGAQMVKLEGGEWLADTVKFLVQRSVPVCGHLGLLPQSIHALGGFKVQGKSPESAQQLIADAIALESAGAQMIVLEAIPSELGARVTQSINIPTIGIGAGSGTDGQILVWTDFAGLYPGKARKFVKQYANLRSTLLEAASSYRQEVADSVFPAEEHSHD
jgi:3-methyl-2-oxobutanoate hydroxymethyltransferase